MPDLKSRADYLLAIEAIEFNGFLDRESEHLQQEIRQIRAAHYLPSGIESGMVDEKIGEAHYESNEKLIAHALRLRRESGEQDRSVLSALRLDQLKQELLRIAVERGGSLLEVDHRDRLKALVERGIAALKLRSKLDSANEARGQANVTTPRGPAHQLHSKTQDWQHVEIRFLSEANVQILVDGQPSPPLTYVEMGFADRRGAEKPKPTRAWNLLLGLAEHDGIVNKPRGKDKQWRMVEKHAQKLRKALRELFGISVDPLPFVPGTGYKAAFKIRRPDCSSISNFDDLH